VELLTWCDQCEDFKSDVMYYYDPDYTDTKDQLNMRLMCGDCDEGPRRLVQEIKDQTCDNCGEFKESTHLRVDPFSEDVFDKLAIHNLCDECHKEAHHDI